MCVCLARARSGAQRRYVYTMPALCARHAPLRSRCVLCAYTKHKRAPSAPCAFPARFVRSAGLSPSWCVIVPPYTRKARKRAKNGRYGAFVVFCGCGYLLRLSRSLEIAARFCRAFSSCRSASPKVEPPPVATACSPYSGRPAAVMPAPLAFCILLQW